jgi:hypothetical protein
MNAFAMQKLPERFLLQPRTQALHDYITQKYSKYGHRKNHPIEYNPEFKAEGSSDRYRWVENISSGLRKVGDAHEIVRSIHHTGWFLDDLFQDETVHGEVYQLPARDGKEQYVPAVNDPYNPDCACVDFSSITDDKEQAARWSDQMAEHWAEREREYQAKERIKQRLEEIEEEIKSEYTDFRRISREIRANCDKVQGVQIVRELVREKWKRTKAAIHKLRRERDKIEAEGY